MMKKPNGFFYEINKAYICALFFALCSLFIIVSANAETIIARDPTINCAGVPQWDRFVVNTKDTKWDPKSAGCYAGAQGAPTAAPAVAARAMYGAYDPNADFGTARAIYGTFDGNYNSAAAAPAAPSGILPEERLVVKPAPANAGQSRPSKPVAKTAAHPTAKQTAKPAAKPVVKTAAKKPAAAPKSVAAAKPKKATEPAPAPTPAPAPAKAIAESAPPPAAANIARAIANNPDNYCAGVNKPVMGKLPPEFILMSGSPDRMCCVAK
ncbi:MAG: hypothetical protein FWC61_04760 [Proteobacteria bacterium]|nr:hypothetical protein [Pseudomonadota bacterium]